MRVPVLNGGFFASPDRMLGASPDGQVVWPASSSSAPSTSTRSLIEIKSPMKALYHAGKEAYRPYGIPPSYMTQMQGQMALADVPFCDFVVFLERPEASFYIMRVHRSAEFWSWVEPKLRLVSRWIREGMPDLVDRSFEFPQYDWRTIRVDPVAPPFSISRGMLCTEYRDETMFPIFYRRRRVVRGGNKDEKASIVEEIGLTDDSNGGSNLPDGDQLYRHYCSSVELANRRRGLMLLFGTSSPPSTGDTLLLSHPLPSSTNNMSDRQVVNQPATAATSFPFCSTQQELLSCFLVDHISWDDGVIRGALGYCCAARLLADASSPPVDDEHAQVTAAVLPCPTLLSFGQDSDVLDRIIQVRYHAEYTDEALLSNSMQPLQVGDTVVLTEWWKVEEEEEAAGQDKLCSPSSRSLPPPILHRVIAVDTVRHRVQLVANATTLWCCTCCCTRIASGGGTVSPPRNVTTTLNDNDDDDAPTASPPHQPQEDDSAAPVHPTSSMTSPRPTPRQHSPLSSHCRSRGRSASHDETETTLRSRHAAAGRRRSCSPTPALSSSTTCQSSQPSSQPSSLQRRLVDAIDMISVADDCCGVVFVPRRGLAPELLRRRRDIPVSTVLPQSEHNMSAGAGLPPSPPQQQPQYWILFANVDDVASYALREHVWDETTHEEEQDGEDGERSGDHLELMRRATQGDPSLVVCLVHCQEHQHREHRVDATTTPPPPPYAVSVTVTAAASARQTLATAEAAVSGCHYAVVAFDGRWSEVVAILHRTLSTVL